ncbi:MAG: hypothetical protein AB7O74_12210, partial [Candidatus Nanopelagicales bacterium]
VQVRTGPVNELALVAPDGTTAATQAIGTSGKCTLSPASGAVASWSASPSTATPGFAYLAIGANGSKQNGTACSQVEASSSESVTLNLDGSSLTSILGPLVGTSARLDVEVKFDAIIRADLLGAPSGTPSFMLYSGSNASGRSTSPTEYVCQLRSDSGPDSGANDNCTWPISAAGLTFTGIRLTAVSGQFALKGGGDYAVPTEHYTTIDVAAQSDGTLDCDSANVASVTGGGQLAGITITRLPNGDADGDGAADPCTAIGYDLDATLKTATFHKPDDGQAAQFTTSITRTFSPAINPVPALAVDWEDGTGAHNLGFCSAAVFSGSAAAPSFDWTYLKNNAAVVDPSNPNASPYNRYDQSPATPGVQHACIYAQSDNLQDDGSVVAADQVYFTGDIKFTTR